MTLVGTFRIDVTVSNWRDRARSCTLPVLVDTGATYTTLPRDVIAALGCEPAGERRVRLADGREETWQVSVVSVQILGQDGPTFCLIGPSGGPALLGAVTLEEFALGVDPIGTRLVPVTSYLCCA